MKTAVVLLVLVAMAAAGRVNVVEQPTDQVQVVNNIPGQVVDPAFYRPVRPGGYEPISTGPALVDFGPGYFNTLPRKPGQHPGARDGK